jgi:DNA-directed RNA polymerase subunit RPC12/RpoP
MCYMTGHRNVTHFLYPDSVRGYVVNPSEESAHMTYVCGICGTKVGGAVVALAGDSGTEPIVRWVRCTSCNRGSVVNVGPATDSVVISPPVRAGASVEGLPRGVNEAFEEARTTLGVGAYTSCELMCRKILMNVAVDKGASPGGTFAGYLDHLGGQGYVTPPMKSWVDVIRKNGNIATHELPGTDLDRAESTLGLTTQLLRVVYEMEHKAQRYLHNP